MIWLQIHNKPIKYKDVVVVRVDTQRIVDHDAVAIGSQGNVRSTISFVQALVIREIMSVVEVPNDYVALPAPLLTFCAASARRHYVCPDVFVMRQFELQRLVQRIIYDLVEDAFFDLPPAQVALYDALIDDTLHRRRHRIQLLTLDAFQIR